MLCHQPLCQTRPDCLRLFEQPPWRCTLGSYVWHLWPVMFLFFSGFPLVLSSPHPPTHRFLDAPSSTRPALTGSSTPAPPTAKLPTPPSSKPCERPGDCLASIPFGMVIIDESHNLRSCKKSDSMQTTACAVVAMRARRCVGVQVGGGGGSKKSDSMQTMACVVVAMRARRCVGVREGGPTI